MKYIIKIFDVIRHIIITPIRGLHEFLFTDLKRVLKNYMTHDGELSTCAIAFFLLISFIPASLVIISILSFIYGSGFIATLYIDQIKSWLPSIDLNDLVKIIDRIIYKKRYLAFIWVPFLFWWGSLVFDILERVLEKAFNIEESRIYWHAKIRHFIIILGLGIFVLFLTILSNFMAVVKNSDIVAFVTANLQQIPIMQRFIITLSQTPIMVTSLTTLVINTCFIFAIYRFVPPRRIDNSSIFKGALFSSLSYEAVKILFSYYITNINDYTSIFGSLSTIVILMIWIWYACFLFVIGAEMSWVFYEKKVSARTMNFD